MRRKWTPVPDSSHKKILIVVVSLFIFIIIVYFNSESFVSRYHIPNASVILIPNDDKSIVFSANDIRNDRLMQYYFSFTTEYINELNDLDGEYAIFVSATFLYNNYGSNTRAENPFASNFLHPDFTFEKIHDFMLSENDEKHGIIVNNGTGQFKGDYPITEVPTLIFFGKLSVFNNWSLHVTARNRRKIKQLQFHVMSATKSVQDKKIFLTSDLYNKVASEMLSKRRKMFMFYSPSTSP